VGDPVLLSFPAIAEADEVHAIETIWGRRCFTRRLGEALHPAREPVAVLHNIRRTIGEYNFAGQYQQSPHPWAAVWSRPNGSSATGERAASALRAHRAELGHRQQSHRAKRF
jgi:hypothetical protein